MSAPLFLFVLGAGAPSFHPWMQRWADRLRQVGEVVTMDYPYMKEGRKRPDARSVLTAAHTQALREARANHGGPVVLMGKSMGSRIGCHVSLHKSVAALVCFGYPLCGAGDRSKLRDQVLRELATPILFIQGTRDKLCPLDLLGRVRAEMAAPNELHIVEEGDHSLAVTRTWLKGHGQTQEEVDERILEAVRRFLAPHTASIK